MTVESRQGLSWPLVQTQRLLTQPVDYATEAAGSRLSAARWTRSLAYWPISTTEAGGEAVPQPSVLPPHHRLHPDRSRTFCMPEGWTSEAQLEEDLNKLHSAATELHKRKPSRKWRSSLNSPSITLSTSKTLPTSKTNARRSNQQSKSSPVIPAIVITRFGDQHLPPPLQPPALKPEDTNKDPDGPPSKDPPLAEKPTPSATVNSTADATPVADYFSLTQTPFGGVTVRRVSAGLTTALVGRNGIPAPPAAATEQSTGLKQTRLVKPNLCWNAELTDPNATVMCGAQPGSKEAAAAAAAAAELEAQKRNRRIVGFDHFGSGEELGTSAREAVILSRLRARSADQQRKQRERQLPSNQPGMGHELTASDYTSLLPIAESVDALRTSKIEATPDQALENSKSTVTEVEASSKPRLKASANRLKNKNPHRRAQSLLTRPIAPPTFSPRRDQATDAGLIVSTLTAPRKAAQAGAASAGVRRVAGARAVSSSSSAYQRLGDDGVRGGETYLSIVSSVGPGRLWSTGGVGRSAPQASPLPPPSLPAPPLPPQPPVSLAPLPSTPREAELKSPSVASTASLTSTKNSEGTGAGAAVKGGAVVKIPHGD